MSSIYDVLFILLYSTFLVLKCLTNKVELDTAENMVVQCGELCGG